MRRKYHVHKRPGIDTCVPRRSHKVCHILKFSLYNLLVFCELSEDVLKYCDFMSRQEVIEIRFHLLLMHQKVGKIRDTEVLDTRELRMMIAQKGKY